MLENIVKAQALFLFKLLSSVNQTNAKKIDFI